MDLNLEFYFSEFFLKLFSHILVPLIKKKKLKETLCLFVFLRAILCKITLFQLYLDY